MPARRGRPAQTCSDWLGEGGGSGRVPPSNDRPRVSLSAPDHLVTRPRVWRAALAQLATTIIWSGNTIVTKAAFTVIAPASIAFYRWALAFLIVLPLVGPAAWRNRGVLRRYGLRFVVLAALGMVLYQSLAYEAGRTTTAVNMGVMIALMPLVSALLASALAGEALSVATIGGGAISLAGLVYLLSEGQPAHILANGLHTGDALMLVATVANSLYGVLLKRWAIPLPLAEQLFWQIGAATLMLLPIWLLGTPSPVTAANLPFILFAAIPTSLVAPLGWMYGVRHMGAARSALFINLVPPIVACLAFVLLGEQLHAYHYIGGGLSLAGVVIGMRRRSEG